MQTPVCGPLLDPCPRSSLYQVSPQKEGACRGRSAVVQGKAAALRSCAEPWDGLSPGEKARGVTVSTQDRESKAQKQLFSPKLGMDGKQQQSLVSGTYIPEGSLETG